MMLPERAEASLKTDVPHRPMRDDHVEPDGAKRLADRIVVRKIVQEWLEATNAPQHVPSHGNGRAEAWFGCTERQRHHHVGEKLCVDVECGHFSPDAAGCDPVVQARHGADLGVVELGDEAANELILNDDIAVGHDDDLVAGSGFQVDEVRDFRILAACAVIDNEVYLCDRIHPLHQPNELICRVATFLRSANELYCAIVILLAKRGEPWKQTRLASVQGLEDRDRAWRDSVEFHRSVEARRQKRSENVIDDAEDRSGYADLAHEMGGLAQAVHDWMTASSRLR